MAVKLGREKVAELSKEIRDRACLTYKPIGFKLVKSEDEIPKEARRPSARGQTWPVCLAGNIVRTIGWTIALTLEDHFCVMAAAGLGHIELPDYLKKGGVGSHHTKNKELGVKIQETLESCFFEPGSTVGIVLTPAEAPLIDAEGVYFYGNPSQVG